MAVGEAEAELDDLLLPLRQGVQDRVELLLEQDEAGRVDGDDGVGVLDEVAEVESSSSPMGVSRRHRLLADLEDLAFSGENSISRPISSGVGSRPRSWRSWRWMRISLLIVSTMCTGMRMVRAWSAMARVMAWRIHQVA